MATGQEITQAVKDIEAKWQKWKSQDRPTLFLGGLATGCIIDVPPNMDQYRFPVPAPINAKMLLHGRENTDICLLEISEQVYRRYAQWANDPHYGLKLRTEFFVYGDDGPALARQETRRQLALNVLQYILRRHPLTREGEHYCLENYYQWVDIGHPAYGHCECFQKTSVIPRYRVAEDGTLEDIDDLG